MAEAYYASIAPHNPLGPISLAAGHSTRRLGAELPLPGAGLARRGLSQDSRSRSQNGYVMVPTGPGLGIELDDDQVAAKIGHDWQNRETYDPDDGSVVDW